MNRSSIRLVSDADAPLPLPEVLQEFAAEAEIGKKRKLWKAPKLTVLHAIVAALAILSVTEFVLLASKYSPTSAELHPVATPAVELGKLVIDSTPPGATFAIDGEERGTTPSALSLKPGNYALSIHVGDVRRTFPLVVHPGNNSERIYLSEAGIAATSVAVAAPGASAASAPASGWLRVTAPIDLQLFENGVLIGSSADRIALSAGRHVIDAVSTAVGYRTTSTVVVPAGSVAPLKLELPNGTLNVNATPWAEIAIDGKPFGPTPIGNISLSLGSHDVVFTHPQLGERRQTVLVTLDGTTRISANLQQP